MIPPNESACLTDRYEVFLAYGFVGYDDDEINMCCTGVDYLCSALHFFFPLRLGCMSSVQLGARRPLRPCREQECS
jgi:hypothetical protein